jgi:hypothetical protein
MLLFIWALRQHFGKAPFAKKILIESKPKIVDIEKNYESLVLRAESETISIKF